MARLKEMILVPEGGMGNRLRAIASARRVCGAAGARCVLAWDWGRFAELFSPPENFAVSEGRRWHIPAGYRLLSHSRKTGRKLPLYSARLVPLDAWERIVVHSSFAFGYAGEPEPADDAGLAPWLPRPSPEVESTVADFAARHFRGPVVGLHLRTTDNDSARKALPEALAFAEAGRFIREGRAVFLASDDPAAEARFRDGLGPGLISFPKEGVLPVRWPRAVQAADEIFRDLVDLFLLARCEFVVGAEASSFCRMAMAYNGSPLCRYLDEKKAAKGFRGPFLRKPRT